MKTMDDNWIKKLPITKIQDVTPVSGGDINESFEIKTPQEKLFMKVQPGRGKAFFDHEVEGIKLLSQAANVPTIVDYGEINGDGYLILKWLEASKQGSQYELGRMVANVHKVRSPNGKFGLDNDFKIGKIPKINTWQADWGKFYLEQRLDPLVKLAKQNQVWNENRQKHYETLRKVIKDYYSDTKHQVIPSLLHGDLWGGNYMFVNQKPVLIDPDVFYGNREMDLALTTVFGGFTDDFYVGYNSVYPIDPEFQKRLPWYQFNYLMAHLNLFGEIYGTAVDQILNRF